MSALQKSMLQKRNPHLPEMINKQWRENKKKESKCYLVSQPIDTVAIQSDKAASFGAKSLNSWKCWRKTRGPSPEQQFPTVDKLERRLLYQCLSSWYTFEISFLNYLSPFEDIVQKNSLSPIHAYIVHAFDYTNISWRDICTFIWSEQTMV